MYRPTNPLPPVTRTLPVDIVLESASPGLEAALSGRSLMPCLASRQAAVARALRRLPSEGLFPGHYDLDRGPGGWLAMGLFGGGVRNVVRQLV
jgi:hypothetical protein